MATMATTATTVLNNTLTWCEKLFRNDVSLTDNITKSPFDNFCVVRSFFAWFLENKENVFNQVIFLKIKIN